MGIVCSLILVTCGMKAFRSEVEVRYFPDITGAGEAAPLGGGGKGESNISYAAIISACADAFGGLG
jgi:hypothetical protein